MSETKWTPAQRAAIDDRGGALLVSAAAGSGKTAVLTERAVRLITDPEHPVDADRLLIVTFTNAAAAELRARIGQALLRRSQAEPGNTALRRQRMLLQRLVFGKIVGDDRDFVAAFGGHCHDGKDGFGINALAFFVEDDGTIK